MRFALMVLFSMTSAAFRLASNSRFSSNRILSSCFSSQASKDLGYMKLAFRQAQTAFRSVEVPIGAVIVDENDTILSSARNNVESSLNPLGHAELEAISKACEVKKSWRLNGCTLYTTLEPCHMCLGAVQNARIKRVVFGAKDFRLGACGSHSDLVNNPKHPFHNVEVDGGVYGEECGDILRKFFALRRQENDSRNVDISLYGDRALSFFNDDNK